TKHDVRRIVEMPVTMQEASLRSELVEQRRPGIRREDVEGCALEPVRLDPLDRLLEHVGLIVIEAEHEATVHLNAMAVQDFDPAGIVLGSRSTLAGGGQVTPMQRLEPDEYAGATREGYLAHQCR